MIYVLIFHRMLIKVRLKRRNLNALLTTVIDNLPNLVISRNTNSMNIRQKIFQSDADIRL